MEVSEGKLCRLAAGFAISNMGQTVPEDISKPPFGSGPYPSPEGQVDQYAGHLIETDEHEKIFHDEARMWYGDLKRHTNEYVLRVHGPYCPWIQQILEAPEA